MPLGISLTQGAGTPAEPAEASQFSQPAAPEIMTCNASLNGG